MYNPRWTECSFVLAIFVIAAVTRNVSLGSVTANGYRSLIRSMIWVESMGKMSMAETEQQDGCVITYFRGTHNLGNFTGDEERVPSNFTHAEVKWTLDNRNGVSLFRNDSPILPRLHSKENIGSVVEVSEFKLLSLTGTKSDGTVVEIYSLPLFLKGDIVYDTLWKRHFKEYNDFIYIDAIDHHIDILHIGGGGIVIGKNNAESISNSRKSTDVN